MKKLTKEEEKELKRMAYNDEYYKEFQKRHDKKYMEEYIKKMNRLFPITKNNISKYYYEEEIYTPLN